MHPNCIRATTPRSELGDHSVKPAERSRTDSWNSQRTVIFVAVPIDDEIPFPVEEVEVVATLCPFGRIASVKLKEGIGKEEEKPFDLIFTCCEFDEDDEIVFVPPKKLEEYPLLLLFVVVVGDRTKDFKHELVELIAPAATAARTASVLEENGFVPTI